MIINYSNYISKKEISTLKYICCSINNTDSLKKEYQLINFVQIQCVWEQQKKGCNLFLVFEVTSFEINFIEKPQKCKKISLQSLNYFQNDTKIMHSCHIHAHKKQIGQILRFFFFKNMLLHIRQMEKCYINEVTTGVDVTRSPIPFHKKTS